VKNCHAYRLALTTTFMLTTVVALAQTAIKSAVLSGGTVNASSASYKLSGLLGEGLVGQSSSASYTVRAGFALSPAERLPDLQVLNATLFPLSVKPGDKTAVTFSIKNIGDVAATGAITVKAYLSVNSVIDLQDVVLATFNVGTDLAVNSTIAFPVGSEDNNLTIPTETTIQSYQILLMVDPANTIVEKNETNNVNSNALLLDVTTSTGGGEPDVIKPTFGTPVKPSFVSADAKVEIPVTDNASGVQSVKFYHKPVTATTAAVEESTTGAAGNYSVTLQTSWADEVGVECYFKATDVAQNEAESTHILLYNPVPASQSIPGLSFGGQPENYRIFSIPYDLTDNSVDEIFKTLGEYDKTKWRVVRYQGGRNVDKKDGLTKIERGQAFWFNAIDNTDVKIGAGTTVDKDQSPDFSLTLDKGYNQVGDPFTFDISWTDVLSVNPTLATKLSQQVLVYNSSAVSLDPSDNLKAWSGGFVLADEAMTLSLPVSLKNGGGRISSTQISSSDPDLDEWLIGIDIQQDGVINSLGGIGMHPDAKQSKDIYDIITPPRFIEYIGMSTEHIDFFEPKFSRDIVTTAESYNWDFALESNINSSQAQISWNNRDLNVSHALVLFYDVAQRVLIDMKQSDHYSFNPRRSSSFRFFFGSDPAQIKPDIQEIGQAWPNPTADVAHIPYLVKERSHVLIDVYDMMGRRINRIVDSEQESGYHTATWNRNSSDGSIVSPGVYLYRMNGSINVGRIIVN
jgi:hypothetical protein